MFKRASAVGFVILAGAILWIVVTVASVAVVVASPAENVGLALFLVLAWVALLGFVVVGKVYDWISWKVR